MSRDRAFLVVLTVLALLAPVALADADTDGSERPPPPLNVTVEADPSGRAAHLRWEPPENVSGYTIQGYAIERVDAHGSRLRWGVGNVTHTTAENLEPGHTYSFSLASTTTEGASPWTLAVNVTMFDYPGTPREVRAMPGPVTGSTLIRWVAPVDEGDAPVQAYHVYRYENNYAVRIGETPPDRLRFIDHDHVPFVPVAYRVHAVNSVGEGPASPIVCAFPNPWPVPSGAVHACAFRV